MWSGQTQVFLCQGAEVLKDLPAKLDDLGMIAQIDVDAVLFAVGFIGEPNGRRRVSSFRFQGVFVRPLEAVSSCRYVAVFGHVDAVVVDSQAIHRLSEFCRFDCGGIALIKSGSSLARKGGLIDIGHSESKGQNSRCLDQSFIRLNLMHQERLSLKQKSPIPFFCGL